MEKLGRNQTKLTLPSTDHLPEEERAWIIVNSHPAVGDIPNLETFDISVLEAVLGSIIDWNLTDEGGTILPITEQNVKLLPSKDFWYIAEYIKTGADIGDSDRRNLVLYLAAIKDKRKPDISPPFAYLLYAYRKRFRISWEEMMATPISVIFSDLEFMTLEGQILGNQEEE